MTLPEPRPAAPDDPLRNGRGLPREFAAFFELKQIGYLKYAHQRLRSTEDARRAVKAAGLRLLLEWSTVLGHPDFEARAQRVLREVVDSYWSLSSETLAPSAEGPGGAAREVERMSRRRAVDHAWEQLERIAPEHADCVRLRTAGLTHEEVARALGITTSEARTGTWMGLRSLRDFADRYTDEREDRRLR